MQFVQEESERSERRRVPKGASSQRSMTASQVCTSTLLVFIHSWTDGSVSGRVEVMHWMVVNEGDGLEVRWGVRRIRGGVRQI
jgi:hypothetical protein